MVIEAPGSPRAIGVGPEHAAGINAVGQLHAKSMSAEENLNHLVRTAMGNKVIRRAFADNVRAPLLRKLLNVKEFRSQATAAVRHLRLSDARGLKHLAARRKVGEFENLEALALAFNLEHVDPRLLPTTLTVLDLSECENLHAWIRYLPQFSRLTTLRVSCVYTEYLWKILPELPNLRSFCFESTQYWEKYVSFSVFAKIPGLTSLSLRGAYLSSDDAHELEALTGLTSLELRNAKLGLEGVRALSNLGKLTSLNVAFNNLGPEGVRELIKLTELTELDVSSNKIGLEGAMELARLVNLKSLNVNGNNIGPKGVLSLAPLMKLERLDIGHNHIGREGFEVVCGFNNLRELDIQRNEIKDRGVRILAKLPNLTSLGVLGRRFDAEGILSFSRSRYGLDEDYCGIFNGWPSVVELRMNQVDVEKDILFDVKALKFPFLEHHSIKDWEDLVAKLWWFERQQAIECIRLTPNVMLPAIQTYDASYLHRATLAFLDIQLLYWSLEILPNGQREGASLDLRAGAARFVMTSILRALKSGKVGSLYVNLTPYDLSTAHVDGLHRIVSKLKDTKLQQQLQITFQSCEMHEPVQMSAELARDRMKRHLDAWKEAGAHAPNHLAVVHHIHDVMLLRPADPKAGIFDFSRLPVPTLPRLDLLHDMRGRFFELSDIKIILLNPVTYAQGLPNWLEDLRLKAVVRRL
ncbi:hypothetical protein [Pandoraea iniqua]|nr:hypothetical protein [Pandoraea iniqua]